MSEPARDADARNVVAVPLAGFIHWAGGLDFIRILLNGLTHCAEFDVALLTARPALFRRLREALRRAWGDPSRRAGTAIDAHAALAGIDASRIRLASYTKGRRGLRRALRREHAVVVLASMKSLGRSFDVPWIGYLYDFQHQHLPEFFTPKERARRDRNFKRLLTEAPRIIVNAKTVCRDAERFLPGSASRITCLPFAPAPRPEWFALDFAATRARYDIPECYFIICNQFWVHKDHPTALRAFARLLQGSPRPEPALVCTGDLHDSRAPAYAQAIEQLVGELGIQRGVRMLGFIPKTDQIALLSTAIAVVQPTLFEGGPGGGAVFDAVAMGVPALVSDLPVNREIIDADCRYFPPGDVAALAQLMQAVLFDPPVRPTAEALMERARRRLEALGSSLRSAIQQVQSGT